MLMERNTQRTWRTLQSRKTNHSWAGQTSWCHKTMANFLGEDSLRTHKVTLTPRSTGVLCLSLSNPREQWAAGESSKKNSKQSQKPLKDRLKKTGVFRPKTEPGGRNHQGSCIYSLCSCIHQALFPAVRKILLIIKPWDASSKETGEPF